MSAFSTIRQNVVNTLIGGTLNTTQLDDSNIQTKIQNIVNTCKSYKMLFSPPTINSTYIFSDLLVNSNKEPCASIGNSYARLVSMAIAVILQGSSNPAHPAYNQYYNDTQLRSDIISSLDWLYTNWSTPSQWILTGGSKNYPFVQDAAGNKNWFIYEITIPLNLSNIICLLYSYLTTTQINNWANMIWFYNTVDNTANPTVISPMWCMYSNTWADQESTGANLAWKAQVFIVTGAASDNGTRLQQGVDAMSSMFAYAYFDDGFYPDGSFIQHQEFPYTYGYGKYQIDSQVFLMNIVNNTSYDITDLNKNNIYNFIYQAYEKSSWNVRIPQRLCGREISRNSSNDRYILGTLCNLGGYLIPIAPVEHQTRLKKMIKYWGQNNSSVSILTSSNIYQYLQISVWYNDTNLTSRGDLITVTPFNKTVTPFIQRQKWAASVSMSNSIIQSYESINNENVKGYNQGNGWIQIFTGDTDQYFKQYHPVVDCFRLTGTTTLYGIEFANNMFNGSSFAGTVTHDNNGISGFILAPEGDLNRPIIGQSGNFANISLSTNKVYFYGDEFILCLGNSITSSDNAPVETIICNNRINSGSNPTNALTVNNTVQSNTIPSDTIISTNWFHIEGNNNLNKDQHLGIYFPTATNVRYRRELRTGKWRDINIATNYSLINNTKMFDSYTDESSPATNYSTATDLLISNTINARKYTFMNFDISNILVNYSYQCILTFVARNLSNTVTTLTITSVTTGWSANAITWSNSPSTISNITTVNILDNIDRIYEIDLTDYVISCYNNGITNVSFRISTSASVDTRIEPNSGNKNECPKLHIYGSPETINLTSTDSWVSELNPTTNYYQSQICYVKNETNNRKESFIKFSITNLDTDSNVYGAILKIYGQNSTSSNNILTIDGISASSWDHTTINWNNRPTTIIQNLGTITTNNTSQYYQIDVSNYVKNRKSLQDTDVAFRIQCSTTDEFSFYSVDNLILTPLLAINLEYKRNFLSATIEHGINASTSSNYAYAIYPNTNASDINTINTNGPDWTIVQNDSNATCVYYHTRQIISTVFWNDTLTSVTSNGITVSSSHKSLVSLKQTSDFVEINCADPTQGKIGAITIQITGLELYGPLITDPNVTISKISNGYSFDFLMTNSLGSIRSVTMAKGRIVFCSADTYVDSGFPTTNFGSASNIVVKNNIRLGYLRFDLSGYSSVTSAKLFLVSQQTTASNGTAVSYGVHELTDNTWSENSVTWNTRPSDTNIINPAIGTVTMTSKYKYFHSLTDVTNLVQTRLQDTKIVNLCLKESTSGNYIMVQSRTNNFCPVLIIDTNTKLVSTSSLTKQFHSSLNNQSLCCVNFEITPSSISNHKIAFSGYSTTVSSIDSNVAGCLFLNSSGNFQCLNNTTYSSVNTVSYSANTTYLIYVLFNLVTKKYTLTVNNTIIAQDYTFNDNTINNIGQSGLLSTSGSITIDVLDINVVNDNFTNLIGYGAPPRDISVTNSIDLPAIDDSFIEQANPNSNFGTNTSLLIKFFSGASRQSYIKFSIANYSGCVSAILKLYAQKTTASNATIQIYEANNDTWAENTLTWNNAPGYTGASLANFTITNQNIYQWYNIDLTSFVKNKINLKKSAISLVLVESTNVNSYIMINSAENASNQLKLSLVYPINTFSYNPSSDVYVQQANPTVNYGSSSSLLLKYFLNSERHSYLTFNLPNISDSTYITSSILKLRAQNTGNAGPVTIGVWQSATNNWVESSITWNTAPGSTGSQLGSMTITGQNTYNNIQLDLTNFVKSQITSTNKLCSLFLKETTTSGTSYIMVDSKETTTGTKPILETVLSIPNNFDITTWSIVSNDLNQSSNYNVNCLSLNNSDTLTDFSLETVIVPKSNTGKCGILYKSSNENNGYLAYLSSGFFKVAKLVANVETLLVKHPITYTTNQEYPIKIVTIGTLHWIELCLGYTLPIYFSFTDSTYSSGYISFYTNDNSSSYTKLLIRNPKGIAKTMPQITYMSKLINSFNKTWTCTILKNNIYGWIGMGSTQSKSSSSYPINIYFLPSGYVGYLTSSGLVQSSIAYSTSNTLSINVTGNVDLNKWSCTITPSGGSAQTLVTDSNFTITEYLTCLDKYIVYSDKMNTGFTIA